MARKVAESKSKTARKTIRKPRISQNETNQTQNQPNRLNIGSLIENRKIIAIFVLVILISGVLLYFFKGLFIASLVNGEPITRLSVIQTLESQNGKATLDNLITKKLILQEEKKRNVQVSKNDIDSEIKKIEESLKTQGTTLDQALESQGMTRNQLNEEIKIQLSIQKMVEKDVKVTDKEINDFVTANKDQFPEASTEAQMKQEASDQLKQQKVQEKTQALISDLQKKAKIRNFVNY